MLLYHLTILMQAVVKVNEPTLLVRLGGRSFKYCPNKWYLLSAIKNPLHITPSSAGIFRPQ